VGDREQAVQGKSPKKVQKKIVEPPELSISTTWLIPPIGGSMGLGDVEQKRVGGLGGLEPEIAGGAGLARETENRAPWARYRWDLGKTPS
jgi:hypothetical protein